MRFRDYVRTVFWSLDAWLAGLTVGAFALWFGPTDTRSAGTDFLTATLTVSMAVLALTLSAMVWVSTQMDDHFRRVLDKVPGGFKGALLPYRVLAVVSGTSAVASLITLFSWDAMTNPEKEAGVLIALGLVVWSLAGVVQLVLLSVWHSEQRGELLRLAGRVRAELRQRGSERSERASRQ